ncbi:MAG TPA: M20/M25/M40 family metallo-hydrolase [bacterium]|nr:M20/M25/M40 family metallo-hydrolase [bacterium]
MHFYRMLIVILCCSLSLFAQAEKGDSVAAEAIKTEAIERSQALQTLNVLTNVIGARLTNSKGLAAANDWTREALEKMGLSAEVEPWGEFGRGWDMKSFRAGIVAPYAIPLIAYPKAWSPATRGTVRSKILYINETKLEDIQKKYSNKLKNAIVLLGDKVKIEEDFEADAKRWSDSELLTMSNAGKNEGRAESFRRSFRKSPRFSAFIERQRIFTWINNQQPALIVDGGSFSFRGGTPHSGVVRVMGASMPLVDESDPFGNTNPKAWDPNPPAVAPQIAISAEQYNQLIELIKSGKEVIMECDLQVEWRDKDLKAYNTIGTWSGSDRKDETVMIGAHLDSWHSSTGATDNAAGVSVMMEAIRILKAIGFQPRRTIKIGLWSAEEQGLLGSAGYVNKHLYDSTGAKPGYEKFNVYFNMDNGGGQIRGIYLQGHEDVQPYFRQWMEPFRSWGASTISLKGTGSTDHMSFISAGLNGFQFIQDPMDYSNITWHTNMDMYDHIQPLDLKRNAAIVAYFVYMSAMSDEVLPKRAIEKE